jgi:PAS domain S-box-containing protein
MKLGTRVKLAGTITVGVFLVYGAALLYMDRTMSHLAQEVQNANEFRNKISLLRTLSLDNLIYQTERSKKQWAAVYGEVRHILDEEAYRRLQLEYNLGDIGDKVKIVGDTFQRLLAMPGPEGLPDSEGEIRRELRNRLTTQLLLTTQDLLNRFVNLSEEVNQRLIRTQRLISLLDILALLFLGLIILSAGVFLRRSVLQPVLKLHKGAEIIGAGNFDYHVGLASPDEIGELSRAFDRMTANLKKVTVSRDDLVREVAERQRLEAALERTREQMVEGQRIAHLGSWEYIAATQTTVWSDEQKRIYGLDPAQPPPAYAVMLRHHIHPDDAAELDRSFREALQHGALFENENRIIRPDGTVRWIYNKALPYFDEHGKLLRYIGATLDITERKEAGAALRESEERLRLLGDNLPESAVYQYVQEPDGRVHFLYFSEGIERLNGIKVQDVLHDVAVLHDQILPEYFPGLEAAEARSARELSDFDMEVPMRQPDGQVRWMRLHSRPRRLPNGRIIWDGVQTDVTERRRAEAALRESEAKYRNLFENMTEEVHFWQLVRDDSGAIKTWRLMDANPPTLKTWGRTRLDEIEGKTTDEIFGPGATDHYLPVVQKIMTEGVPYAFDDYFPNLDKYFRFTSVPLGDYFITTGADITSIKKAEQAIRESRDDLDRAQAVAHTGSWRLEVRKNELTWSEENHRIFGIPPGRQMTYETFLGTVHPEDREYVDRKWQAGLRGEPYDIEHRIVVDGTIKWVRERAELEFDQEGRLLGGFGTTQDITERKRAEEALRESSAELARAVAELEETNAEMERFTYMISHDLKSPLVTISTFLGFLEEDLGRGNADRIDKDMNFMRTAADKMALLLSELLELSRLGRVANPPQEVTFRELVQESLLAVAGPIAAQGVEVQVSGEDITLFGDRPRLVEIWQNLVENAVKFMGEQAGPRLTIGLERQADDTRFFVCDNGIGIDPLYQERIFGIFEKLDPKGGGTGIGLAVVKRIAELYQGKIWVESAGPGQGACFWFTLPGAVRGSDRANSE